MRKICARVDPGLDLKLANANAVDEGTPFFLGEGDDLAGKGRVADEDSISDGHLHAGAVATAAAFLVGATIGLGQSGQSLRA